MSKILIIGNGFDLNLGLNTSYANFLESQNFKELITGISDQKNGLAHYLAKIKSEKNWVDVEHELKNYTKTIAHSNPKKIHSEFVSLKNKLLTYLSQEISKHFTYGHIHNNQTDARSLLVYGALNSSLSAKRHSPEKFTSILSFNYTTSLQYFNIESDVYYIHGSIEKKDIVFGVEDGAVDENFNFLNKSDHHAYGNTIIVSNAILDAHEIHFFGCSLGDTDIVHFSKAFEKLSESNKGESKVIYFYVYGKDGYINIRNRLLSLTGNKFAELKSNHQLVFHDLLDRREIDQKWLNSLY